jgi:hypothetical protein
MKQQKLHKASDRVKTVGQSPSAFLFLLECLILSSTKGNIPLQFPLDQNENENSWF